MGKRGPAPQPTALKILRGNPGLRKLNEREAQPTKVKPRCPSYLSAEAKREWRRVSKYLYDAGLLSAIDLDALAMYCDTVALWIEATQKRQEKGLVGTTVNGNLIQNPYLSIANRAKRDALRFMHEFGMTPSSRSRIIADAGGPEQEPTLADALFQAVNRD